MSSFIDPDMLPILAEIRAAPPIDFPSTPIAQVRAMFDRGVVPWSALAPAVAEVDELTLPGAAGRMRARLYRPAAGKLPLIIFVHGGGWTVGNVDSHEIEMRHLALASGAAVLGFDYRLAPEHPFPAAHDDVLAAIAAAQAGALGDDIDSTRLALAGDSAGANLALGALLARPDLGIRAAALFYGGFAPIFDSASNQLFGAGDFGLSTAKMRWYWRNFLGAAFDAPPPAAAPLEAQLPALPPLLLVAAGLDPLRDETLRLAERLAAADSPHELLVVPGVIHGFLGKAPRLPAARKTLETAGIYLAQQLTTKGGD